MDQELTDVSAYAPGDAVVHSIDGSTFLHEMTSWPPS